MLEKFLNKNVEICLAEYAKAIDHISIGTKGVLEQYLRKGTVTRVDDNFIELDNNLVIAIKYITTIKSL